MSTVELCVRPAVDFKAVSVRRKNPAAIAQDLSGG